MPWLQEESQHTQSSTGKAQLSLVNLTQCTVTQEETLRRGCLHWVALRVGPLGACLKEGGKTSPMVGGTIL